MSVTSTNGSNFATVDAYRAAKKESRYKGPDVETELPDDPQEAERRAMREQAEAERARAKAERAVLPVRSAPVVDRSEPEPPKKPLPMPEPKPTTVKATPKPAEPPAETKPPAPKAPEPVSASESLEDIVKRVTVKAAEKYPEFGGMKPPTCDSANIRIPIPVPLDSEIAAMAEIANTLRRLNSGARARVLSWVADRFPTLPKSAPKS